MIDTKYEHCSFCGKHKDSTRKLIVGNDVGICNECVDLCVELLADVTADTETIVAPPEAETVDPVALKEYLDQYVIDQDAAKIMISVAIANHYKRINNTDTDVEIDKANLLLLGPTGSGKTLLARSVAKFLDVPFAVADATSLTEAGYVGDDVETLIARLLTAAGGDVEKAQHGIIFVDEIDKIARKSESASITRDVSGEGVQQALLKLVEGASVRVPTTGNRKHPSSEMVEVNTKNILFIAGGAFVGLEKIIDMRKSPTTVGFTNQVHQKSEAVLGDVQPDDLVKYGLIPEFVGRFPNRVTLEKLSKDALVKILSDVKNSLTKQYQTLFSIDGVALEFDPESLVTIAERTMTANTGARGLQTELERTLLPYMYNIKRYRKNGNKSLTITSELVNNPATIRAQAGG